jgi:RING finger protein 113A
VKRRKRNTAVVAASSKDTTSKHADWGVGPAEVDRSIPITDSNDATKQSNWYEKEADGSSIPAKVKPTEGPDGTYKGLANQTSYIEKNPDRQSRTVGPVKAPTNIRTITVTDFAPDVCKDCQ